MIKPYFETANGTIYNSCCLDVLREMPENSIHCCVTSPPYYGLRDYGVDGQIGLEESPEAYVEKMVAVFREVYRVLRDDGTVWLNLGDSYWGGKGSNGSSKARRTADERGYSQSGGTVQMDTRPTDGSHDVFKPKDLIGIPWLVAKALQEPYYTGKISNIADRVWLAAMIDGEGCMFIHKRKVGQSNGQGYFRKSNTYSVGLEVANTHESIVQRCMEITGQGSICRVERESKNRHRNIPLYRWNMRSNQCREIIKEVYPYLVGKKHEARLILGCPSSGDQAEKSHAGLMRLHNGGDAGIDFPEPASMYEPGWYLRQDIIWKKPNPMPESVTDRCTKSHEYIFLLTKSARYFYDAEAVKEPVAESAIGRGLVDFGGKKGREYNPKPGDPNFRNGKEQWGRTFDYAKSCANGRNRRSVWTVATQPYSGAHFATFPPKLIEPCILAGCPDKCCSVCGKGWERVVERTDEIETSGKGSSFDKGKTGERDGGDRTQAGPRFKLRTNGFQPSCSCGESTSIPGTVLDPFFGAGTSGLVAYKHDRKFIGIELNPDYAKIAAKRIRLECQQLKLF